jgi:hypothetical protein
MSSVISVASLPASSSLEASDQAFHRIGQGLLVYLAPPTPLFDCNHFYKSEKRLESENTLLYFLLYLCSYYVLIVLWLIT